MDKMTDIEEEAQKLAEETRAEEEAQSQEERALFNKVFTKDSSGEFLVDEQLKKTILAEEKSIDTLERLIEKAKLEKKTREKIDSNKLQTRLIKKLQEMLEQKRNEKFDEEIKNYQQEKESSQEDKASFQYFDCLKEEIKTDDLKGEPVLFTPNFLTEGEIHILVGKAGSGKSYLASQLALSAARGEEFLGMKPPKKRRVAFLSFEDSRSRLLQRLLNIGKEKNEMIDLQLYTNLSPLIICSGGKTEITHTGKSTAQSLQKENPDLLIIDTYAQAFLHEDGDNRGSQSVGNWLRKEFKDKTILIIHHVRKAEEFKKIKEVTLDAVRGASALVGYARSAFLLGVDDGRCFVLQTLKSNYGEPFSNYESTMFLEKDIVEVDGNQVFRGFKKDEEFFDNMEKERQDAEASAAEKLGL